MFQISDPKLFPFMTHAQKRDPRSDFRSGDNLLDFMTLRPETFNAATIVFSDYGLPDGYECLYNLSVSFNF